MLLSFATCGTVIGVPPTIHIDWDETPAPGTPTDYIITTTDPNYPDIELVTGSLTWKIWSTDTDNPNNIGDIGVISCPHADNFAVSILTDTDSAGARDVKGITLDPGNSNNYANIVDANITGQIMDDLIVKPDSSGSGGEITSLAVAELTADVTAEIVGNIQCSYYNVTGTYDIGEVQGSIQFGGFNGDITIDKLNGTLRFFTPITGYVTASEMGYEGNMFFPSGIASTGVVTIGDVVDASNIYIDSVSGFLHFLSDFPNSLMVEELGPIESSGSLIVNGSLSAYVSTTYIAGTVIVGEDLSGSLLATGDITGDVTVDGDFSGNICAGNLAAGDALPSNIDVNFVSGGTVCSAAPCLVAEAPTTVSGAIGYAKNRYVSFDPENAGFDTAFRVTLSDSDDFPTLIGTEWWVGAPSEYCENAGQTTPPVEGCSPGPGG